MDGLISRQKAIDDEQKLINKEQAIDKLKKRLFETALNNVGIKQDIDETLIDVAENRLENWFDELLSAEPERKTGRWIRNDNNTYSCSVCQSWIPEEQHYYAQFCLYCGADMRGDKHETN